MNIRKYLLMGILFLILNFLPVEFVLGDTQIPSPAIASKPLHRIPLTNSEVKVDAMLEEDVWKNALKINANIEVRPGENITAPVRTEALLAYDLNHIYVAIQAYDPEPAAIRAHVTDRDEIWDDDWVLILFDTFNDQRRMYDFACNPFGIQADLIESNSGGSDSWDTLWQSAGRITEEGFIVEMAIPFSSLSFQDCDGDQIWGFDVVRSYPRNVRHHIGAFPRDRSNNCYMCQALKMVGFNGAQPGKNIEFAPTVATVNTQERRDDTTGPFVNKNRDLEPGISASWAVTPNLKLNGTLNPDFSQIEADAAQLDINRQFAIYYSEKRPFFLEGFDMFNTRFDAVYTRTLADPDWGLKLTGKQGPNTIGFFSARDQVTNLLFPGSQGSNSTSLEMQSTGSVLRYRRDVGKSSNLGVLITDREGKGYHNRLGGFDGILKFNPKDQIRFQALNSNTQYPTQVHEDDDPEQPKGTFSGSAYDLYITHETRNFEVYSLYKQVSPDFRADLGFMSRVDYRYSEIGGTYKWQRDPGSWFTWISLYGSQDVRRDYQYRLLHKAYTNRLNYEGPMQSYLGYYFEIGKDHYAGKLYRANWIDFWAGFQPASFIELEFDGTYGDQIDYDNSRSGTCFQINPEIELRLGKHLWVELEHEYEYLNVDPGRLYTARINRLKMIYQFNRRTFLRTIVQSVNYERNVALYEDSDVEAKTNRMFSQFLFSYKINPQTVFFIGYSDNYYGDQQLDLRQTNRTLFAKLGYAWRI